MKKIIGFILLTISLFAIEDDNIKIMTENYPPYNMEVDGELEGISIDVLEAMLEQMNSKQDKDDIILTSWSRAYSLAQKKKNNMVFSTTRTKEREPLFKWVGPIIKTTISVIAPKSKNITIKKVSDFNKYRIGAVLKDVGEQLILEKGVNKHNIKLISGKNSIKLSFTKMVKDRIDMFAYDENVAFYYAKRNGFNIDDFEVIYTLKEAELYFAFNKNTDDKIINRWQKALDTIKSNGRYKKIINP